MRKTIYVAGGLALFVWAASALADDMISVAGRQVEVVGDGIGSVLTVYGTVLHENGVIYLDPEPLTVGGVTVITGSAGAGGNASNAAPFVLAFPEGGAPDLHGPVNSCAYLPIVDVKPGWIIFASDPVPSQAGEVWAWSPSSGIVQVAVENWGPVEGLGWDRLNTPDGAHPVKALALASVYEALVLGLGPDYDDFAERISGLGFGDLTGEGYQGEGCLKLTCEENQAVLYLYGGSEQPFVIWKVSGEASYRIWPAETRLWPPEAMAVLRDKAGQQ